MTEPGSKMTVNEMNNNKASTGVVDDPYETRTRSGSRTSVSSASSCHSDSSEDGEAAAAIEHGKEDDGKQSDIKRLRSMSDGATAPPNEEIFPSLPDDVLEKMGLLGHGVRERIDEEEQEQKFATLALAFSIDAATIKDRCERQRRYRDQTETNLTVEIDRLVEKIQKIQPFCVNAETTELLTGLLAQVELVVKAAAHAAISAERFGAVQHEEKLAESVSLMVNHVTLLKQQRDSAKKQLQYTKRVLQDTNNPEIAATKQRAASTSAINLPNKRIDRRRASIATISQPQDHKRITRRISDLSLRATALLRSSRPSRLELGVDLSKIKEGTVENEPVPIEEPVTLVNQSELEENEASPVNNSQTVELDVSHLPLRYRILHRVRTFRKKLEIKYTQWTNDGTLHEIFCFAALMCFSFSVITMANLLIEMELAKRGIDSSKCPWYWTAWHDVVMTTDRKNRELS